MTTDCSGDTGPSRPPLLAPARASLAEEICRAALLQERLLMDALAGGPGPGGNSDGNQTPELVEVQPACGLIGKLTSC